MKVPGDLPFWSASSYVIRTETACRVSLARARSYPYQCFAKQNERQFVLDQADMAALAPVRLSCSSAEGRRTGLAHAKQICRRAG